MYCFTLYQGITLRKVSYFLKISYRTKYHYPTLSGISVTPNLEARKPAILVLFKAGM